MYMSMYHISLCKYANALTAMYIKNLNRISVLYRIRRGEIQQQQQPPPAAA